MNSIKASNNILDLVTVWPRTIARAVAGATISYSIAIIGNRHCWSATFVGHNHLRNKLFVINKSLNFYNAQSKVILYLIFQTSKTTHDMLTLSRVACIYWFCMNYPWSIQYETHSTTWSNMDESKISLTSKSSFFYSKTMYFSLSINIIRCCISFLGPLKVGRHILNYL